jgi:hypothetical protein
VPLLSAARLVL